MLSQHHAVYGPSTKRSGWGRRRTVKGGTFWCIVGGMDSSLVAVLVNARRLSGIVACSALLVAVGARLVSGVWVQGGWWLLLPGLSIGYVGADLVSGVMHWLFDTVVDERTPVLGAITRPFRHHHGDPQDIVQHSFLKLNGNNGLALVPLLAIVWVAGGPTELNRSSIFAHALVVGFALAISCTNQIHQWAHAEQAPSLVRWLQGKGLILSPARHNLHHRPPFSNAYCITTGWMNPWLDRVGILARLERALTSPRRIRGESGRGRDDGSPAPPARIRT